MAAPSLSSKF
ncbi:hypothetical protein E2C01_056579 [Portunus trituberculatus]|uniref:Uncharacterized protein n=1 Tax=Portunus trituberculatus TaxID=210409 RepID=A0A5B7H0Y0_PORTR|nr:hypothetical protein [Portunus trituberculatus]